MGFFNLFHKKKPPPSQALEDRGILVFENTSEVIRAETALKTGGWAVRVMGPPPEIRPGD